MAEIADSAVGASPPPAEYADHLMTIINSASNITDPNKRDFALLDALRSCRHELESAEAESEATQRRLADAKDTFDCAAKLLSGLTPSSLKERGGNGSSVASSIIAAPSNGAKNQGKRDGTAPSDTDQYWKRSKTTASSSPSISLEDENNQQQSNSQTVAVEALAAPIPIPTNPIQMPAIYTSVEAGAEDNNTITMSEQAVATHRANFYKKLLGVSTPSEVENYTPVLSQANLRNKSQLAEHIYIVRNWDTGAEGLDAASFRAKHKNWYSRMKPVTPNSGRRTGIHLRTLEPTPQLQQEQGGTSAEEEVGETVLCRYNKEGTKSTIYLAVTQLYDALFEIHCLEHNHARGKDAVKNRVDELYANIPDMQVKYFLDACPVCLERKGVVVENIHKHSNSNVQVVGL
ncbi:hypothetical protein ACHAXR_013125 [Thalassiosira sp. AJA248-18]